MPKPASPQAGSPAEAGPRYPLASVDNALRLILMICERRVVKLGEAARELGVSSSTSHRLLAMLQHRGFVRQDPSTKAYMLGRVLVPIVGNGAGGLDLGDRSRPLLEQIARKVGETAHLCVLEGRETVFLASVESTQPLRTGSRAGLALPAHCTSGGKVLLSQLSRDKLLALYGGREPEAMTGLSLSGLAALEKELAGVSRRGYGTNLGESEPEIAAVGVAMETLDGAPPIALAISAPASRLQRRRIPKIAQVLRAAAGELRDELAALLGEREGSRTKVAT